MSPMVLKIRSKLLCFKEAPKISVEEWLEVMKFIWCSLNNFMLILAAFLGVAHILHNQKRPILDPTPALRPF